MWYTAQHLQNGGTNAPWRVFFLRLQVVEIHMAESVCGAGDVDDARRPLGIRHKWQQRLSEKKVAARTNSQLLLRKHLAPQLVSQLYRRFRAGRQNEVACAGKF